VIRALTVLIFVAAISRGACLPVVGSHIFGRDLAVAEPHFAALPATLEVGFPPAPGTRRVFITSELTRIARANGLSFVPSADICFELAMHDLLSDAALTAMQQTLPSAQIKIVELQKTSVPEGALEFPAIGLEPERRDIDTRLWRGFVRYAGTRREPVWARVTVSGVIQTTQTARPAITADVRSGDAVRVEVECGPAHLVLDAVAAGNGHTGEMVELRNPSSGKTFQARLLTRATAKLVLSPGQTL
jgi:hypothetical protein